jgi:hypothetical protein
MDSTNSKQVEAPIDQLWADYTVNHFYGYKSRQGFV